MTEKVEGIVLRSLPFKERERILTLFSKEAGIIQLILKISSKQFSLLALSSPLACGEFLFTKGKSDLYRFLDGTLLEGFSFLRTQWRFLQTASSLMSAVSHSQLPGKPAPLLYALLLAYLKQIPHFPNQATLLASFYLKLLSHEGELQKTTCCQTMQQLVEERSFEALKKIETSAALFDRIYAQLKFSK